MMKTNLFLVAGALYQIAFGAATSSYSAHDGKKYMDAANSTKDIGLVAWVDFFQDYVDTKTPVTPDSGYSASLHACWFQFFVEQWWSAVDDRYAITAV
jgi:hypothetical protein